MGLTTEQLAAAVLVVIGACFVYATLAVLGHRLSTQLRKHDIIADARRRRLEYLNAVAKRAARVAGSDPGEVDMGQFNVDIVDDEDEQPAQAMRDAA